MRRWGIARLALRALLGRLRQDREFEALTVPHVEVAMHRSIVRVALDGEVFRMESPLRYRVPAPRPAGAGARAAAP